MIKIASDLVRIRSNISRLENLKERLHDLSYFVTASQSGAYHLLQDMIKEKIVLGRPKVLARLRQADLGENDQKIALDAPGKFAQIIRDVEKLVDMEIQKEQKEFKKLTDGK